MNYFKGKRVRKITAYTTIIIALAFILFSVFGPFRPFEWPTRGFCDIELNRDILEESLALGTQFMLAHQNKEGNFTYEYDWINDRYNPGDNQVRQAGALWGLALIYQHQKNNRVRKAMEKSFNFFLENSTFTSKRGRYVTYPGDRVGRLGTVALVALAHIDYLRALNSDDPSYQVLRERLDEYMTFLVFAQTPSYHFHSNYRYRDGKPFGMPNPYFDGESLLALIKYTKYMRRPDYKDIILNAADSGYQRYVIEALKEDRDSPKTKGYYQWSTMAFFEIATTDWEKTDKYEDRILKLADWMIYTHNTLWRNRNTAYAYEGIIHAYQMAKLQGDINRMHKYKCVIDTGLDKLISWQIGNQSANYFIKFNYEDNKMAIGGIQNHAWESPLRIDVVQHQMHATILALKYAYPMKLR